MTYTCEQLEQMSDDTLERKARQVTSAYPDIKFMPCTYDEHSHRLQDKALREHSVKYVAALEHLINPIIRHSSTWHQTYAALILKATRRQRTIAAILTLQSEPGGIRG